MKSGLLILFFLFSIVKFSFAQEDPVVKQQRIEALKIAFISQKLDLSPTEAEKFWPVYYKYETELKQVHKEANSMDVIDKDEKLLNIRKKYKNEFSGIVGAKRVNNLFKSENEFRAVLLRHIQRQNQAHPNLNIPQTRPLPVPHIRK